MSDDPPASKNSPDNLPKGRRVVRRGSRKKRKSRQTLFLKKREILRDMISDEGTGAISVKDQLSRLKSARKAEVESKPVDAGWGNADSGRRGARLVLWSLALVVPLLAIVTAFVLSLEDRQKGRTVNQLNFDFNLPGKEQFSVSGPSAWFEENPHEHYVAAIQILDQLNQSTEGNIPDTVFRRQAFAVKEIETRGLGWDSDFMTADPRTFQWTISGNNEISFLVLEGLRADQTSFRSYFVDSGKGLKMDWAASTAWSEVPAAGVVPALEGRPVMLRCILDKQPHYDSSVDETRSWFVLRLLDSGEPLWGFAPKGSPLDRALLDLFNFGDLIFERKENQRAVVRIRKGESGLKANQVEIVELLANDWVLP